MAKHNSQAAAKRARNGAYAVRFARRNRSEKKAARTLRTAERERRWLVAHSIEPIVGRITSPARRKQRRAA